MPNSADIAFLYKCVGSLDIINDHKPDWHPVAWAWMTSQSNVALICKLHGSLMYLDSFEMLSMGVFITRHWQTFG